MIYHDYQEYLAAIKRGERGIKFERVDIDDEFIISKPFSAVLDFNESIRNGAA